MPKTINDISVEDRNFYLGTINALAVIRMHGAETIYREIMNTLDIKELVLVAQSEPGDARFAGLIEYGYCDPQPGDEE